MDAAALTDYPNCKSPARAGLFLFRQSLATLCDPWRRLTSSNDDGASSGDANDGGDASPNACDAIGGGASPNAGGPSRGDGRVPSALVPA